MGNIPLGKENLWRSGSKRPRRVTGPLLFGFDWNNMFQSRKNVPRRARIHSSFQKVPTSETFFHTGIKTHAYIAGFYENACDAGIFYFICARCAAGVRIHALSILHFSFSIVLALLRAVGALFILHSPFFIFHFLSLCAVRRSSHTVPRARRTACRPRRSARG